MVMLKKIMNIFFKAENNIYIHIIFKIKLFINKSRKNFLYEKHVKMVKNMELISLFKNSNNIDDKTYLKYIILYHAAPTLFSNKPSTLITFNKFGTNTYDLWQTYKDGVSERLRCNFIELYDNGERCTVLFYDKKNLICTLYSKDNMKFLQQYGYRNNMNISEMFNFLKLRCCSCCPHEIGIFLGFPIDDVKEFIYGKNNDYLLNGYWKVYHNLEKAKKIFSLYDEAKNLVIKHIFIEEKINMH